MTSEPILTHDEKKASEAAFRGLPFNPGWSQSAKAIYDGILSAMEKNSRVPIAPDIQSQESSHFTTPKSSDDSVQTTLLMPEDGYYVPPVIEHSSTKQVRSRREALKAGFLIDVSPIAQNVGLELNVSMTRPLWENGILSTEDLTEEKIQLRVRDVLMAVRIRLASLKDQPVFVQVPALLSPPPDTVPDIFLLYALFHTDPIDGDCLLLIHPDELPFSTRPFNQN